MKKNKKKPTFDFQKRSTILKILIKSCFFPEFSSIYLNDRSVYHSICSAVLLLLLLKICFSSPFRNKVPTGGVSYATKLQKKQGLISVIFRKKSKKKCKNEISAHLHLSHILRIHHSFLNNRCQTKSGTQFS